MFRAPLVAACTLSLCGCLVVQPPVVNPTPAAMCSTDTPVPTPPETPAVEPVRRAAQLQRSEECAAEAREAHASAPAWSWELLKACAARGHFTALRELLDGTFDAEWLGHPEAPSLLARMIAMRGGAIE